MRYSTGFVNMELRGKKPRLQRYAKNGRLGTYNLKGFKCLPYPDASVRATNCMSFTDVTGLRRRCVVRGLEEEDSTRIILLISICRDALVKRISVLRKTHKTDRRTDTCLNAQVFVLRFFTQGRAKKITTYGQIQRLNIAVP